jgi:hypothetical protein
MGKVNCGFCNKFMGFTVGLGYHPNGNGAQKSADGTWCCSSTCARDFNVNRINSGSQNSNSSSSKSNPGIISNFIQNQREEDRLDEERRQKKEDTIDSTVESIIAVQFGQSVDEISDSLNKLVTISTSNNDEKIKKAIYEKMDYGIIKLKKLGADSEADFFSKKLDTIYIDKKKVKMEKAQISMEKAQKLKSENKNIQAFLVEHPTITKMLIVIGIILLMQLKDLIF